MDVYFESVAGEMLAHIGALDLVLLAAFARNDDDFNATALADERNGIGNRARCRAAAVPADHHIIGLERRLLNIGHHDHWPAGFEQRGFADDLLQAADFRLRLTDNREIETPRH